MQNGDVNVRMQRIVAVAAVLLMIFKVAAYFITQSVSILTDALESTVNVVAGLVSLYSVYLAALPRDMNHPYGHGKAEFLSAALEGGLIILAGLFILIEAIRNLIYPTPLQQLTAGMILIGITAVVNAAIGMWCLRVARRTKSLAVEASGRHLLSDTLSTLAVIIGLMLIMITSLQWIDRVVALIFSVVIMVSGYRILRKSLAGIMDEQDMEVLHRLAEVLNKNRSENWIDLHKVRVIKYGSALHVDAHLTLPWYFNVQQSHEEVERLNAIVQQHFGDALEMYIHNDACQEFSCRICSKADCSVRRHPFERKIPWTVENLITDKRHGQ
ncbi:MAG: cation diffusion facilitator family transporter [Cyclobacteriaceae bacterium]|nr:cation diffusion facilitator family transporter [Cyclobacteriaceae bacterium]MCX7637921.1 cation diffusion facilitator family transporter [Cyclobacteriaceae bacterium]